MSPDCFGNWSPTLNKCNIMTLFWSTQTRLGSSVPEIRIRHWFSEQGRSSLSLAHFRLGVGRFPFVVFNLSRGGPMHGSI